jgi:prevent-host-death family protein
MEINVHQAKTQLSRLLRKVAEGEEITIARAGVPVAKLVAVRPASGSRPIGMDAGKIWMADDFDAPLPEFEAYMQAEIPQLNFAPKREPRPAATEKRRKGAKKA